MRGIAESVVGVDSKQGWYEYQQSQLAVCNVDHPDLQMAFPGALLFNHLLVCVDDDPSDAELHFSVPEVSDVVYERCSVYPLEQLSSGAVVLDIEASLTETTAQAIGVKLNELRPQKIICLGKRTHQQFTKDVEKCCDIKVLVSMIEPDWMSAASLHRIYSQALTTIFVDTMRVLDAVCTGCDSIFIAYTCVSEYPAFPALNNYLNTRSCEVINVAGVDVNSTSSRRISSFRIIDNSYGALKQSFSNQESESDWLMHYIDRDVEPVIKPYRSKQDAFTELVHGKKASIGRKIAKLRRDPVAFFVDSNHRILKRIGNTLRLGRKARNTSKP